jgi:hypothetical protein
MRIAAALLIALAAALPARAEPAMEARSAMRACLEAVIDGAPVGNVKGLDVEVVRDTAPNACTVRVTAGSPSDVRATVIEAVMERPERFTPAKTSWDPGPYESRETFCNAPGGRAVNVVVNTARAHAPAPVLTATAVQPAERDTRCDLDAGLQRSTPD